jgi:cytochrome c oxidase subunit 2
VNVARSILRSVRAPRRLVPFVVVLGGSLLLAPDAFANFFSVKSGGSPNADEIHSLYKIIFWMGAIVWILVTAALLYAVFRFRAKRNPVASQIHGHTQLEIGWTLGAALLLVILTVVTFVKLNGIVNPPNSSANGFTALSASLSQPNPPNGKKYVICIQARQFFWRYVYGNGCNRKGWAERLPYSYEEMYAPAHTTVELLIQSTDVIHAWWIPSLGGKVDAVPGYTTYTWFNAEHANKLYHGQCAQLCGRQHAFMTALVKVLTPSQFQQWLSRQRTAIQQQNDQVSQLRQALEQQGSLTSNGNF